MEHLGYSGWALYLHKTYVNGVQNKLFASFDDMTTEAYEVAERVFCDLSSGGDPEADNAFHSVDQAEEAGTAHYENIIFVRNQLCALAVVGMYQLWEREVKKFIMWAVEQAGCELKNGKCLKDFYEIRDALNQLCCPVDHLNDVSEINLSRLIANTIKHGQGTSFNELQSREPNLFRGDTFFETVIHEPEPEHLFVDLATFCRMAAAFEAFWESMPEYPEVPHAS